MTANEKARLLGLFFWIYAGMQVVLVGVIGVIYVVFFGVMFSQIPHRANEPNPAMIVPFVIVIMLIVFCVVVLFSIPKIVAGYGLRHEKSWAKVWAIIASCLAVMSFPVGTALGVFGLVFIFGDDGKRYFDGPEYGKMPAAPDPAVAPPEPNSWQ